MDLVATYRELKAEIDLAIDKVLESGSYILGKEVEDFESSYAKFTESQFCIGVGSGLSALEIALSALGVGPGDEVIVPSNTFIATWFAVSNVGATPVSVDYDPKTYNIDPLKVEQAISEKTKVIIPVHLYGSPADIDPILGIAQKHGLRVIEDAAQAQGSTYKGRKIGSHSDFVAWSFYPGKNLGAFGDGGAITTNDPLLAEAAKKLRNYGSDKKYFSDTIGTNSRLDPIQAAILSVKLPKLDEWNRRRQLVADRYVKSFQGLNIKLPELLERCESSWHLFVIESPDRDSLMAHLSKSGIQTQIHYPVSPANQVAYKNKQNFRDCTRETGERSLLSLPIGPHLSDEDQNQVIDSVLEFFRGKR